MTHVTGFRIWITVGRVGLHIIDNFLFDTQLVVVQRLSHLWRLAMMELCLMKIAAKKTQTLPSQSSHENRQLPSGGLRCASRVGAVPLQWTRTEKRFMQRRGTGNFNKTPLFATTQRQFPREAQQHYRLTYLSRSPPVTVSWLKSFSCHNIGRTAVTQCPTTNGTFRLIRGWKRESVTRTWNHPTKISYSPKSILGRHYHLLQSYPRQMRRTTRTNKKPQLQSCNNASHPSRPPPPPGGTLTPLPKSKRRNPRPALIPRAKPIAARPDILPVAITVAIRRHAEPLAPHRRHRLRRADDDLARAGRGVDAADESLFAGRVEGAGGEGVVVGGVDDVDCDVVVCWGRGLVGGGGVVGGGGRTGLPDDAVGGEGHGVGGGAAMEGEMDCLRGVGALLEGGGEGQGEDEEGEGLHCGGGSGG